MGALPPPLRSEGRIVVITYSCSPSYMCPAGSLPQCTGRPIIALISGDGRFDFWGRENWFSVNFSSPSAVETDLVQVLPSKYSNS